MASKEEAYNDTTHEYEPLDTLQIKVCSKNGIETMVSGIHIGFMETRYYVHFKIPPATNKDSSEDCLSAEEEEWLEYMTFLEEDLHWLLRLPHQRFWSQIVYDESLHRCLESYLSQAPRDYDIDNMNIKEELLCSLKKVHKLVFLVYLRMSTYKESKKHHIRPKAFGEIIYDNFIFDVPKIMDLCALYGIQNSSIVSKMVQNIFSSQPKYKDDLDETSKVILTAFNTIEEKLLNISSKHCDSNKTVENGDAKQLSLYLDMINYITDVSITIHAFLENFPPACQTFHQNGAVLRIPTFFEQVFPTVEREISKKSQCMENESIFEDIKRKIVLSKTSLIRVFRNILNYTCIQNIVDSKMTNGDKMIACSLAENFLEVIMELLFNKSFLRDYNLLYPFETDLEFFNELGINLDTEKTNYIFCRIYDSEETTSEQFTSSVSNGARPKVKKQTQTASQSELNLSQTEQSHKPVQNLHGLADMLRMKDSEETFQNEDSASSKHDTPNPIEINSLIQSVLDILPSYGEGFIEKCLEYFAYDSEKVIDSVLSNSLPEHLSCLDKDLKREPKNAVGQDCYSILSERKSVFDNDEFDMFSRNDVNMENVHIGKKNKTPTMYQTLQYDEESEFLKQLTLACGSEETESNSQINLYEDEYDDTYDSTMVGLKEPPLEDVPDDDDVNDEEEKNKNIENSNVRQSNSQDFCINPEILRERAEQRWQARGGYTRSNRGSRATDQPHNRQQKDRHKANVGNHNRRKQSDFKKSRGMVPFPTR